MNRSVRLARYWSTVSWNHLPPNRFRSVFVLGHPRTGTNWFCRIASDYFDLPVYVPKNFRGVPLHPVVLHLHRFAVVPARTVYLLRDARDVIVSYYFKLISSLPRTETVVARIEKQCPRPMTRENIRENLPVLIRVVLRENRSTTIPYLLHVRRAQRLGLHVVRFEDLLTDTTGTITKAIAFLSGETPDQDRIQKTVVATSFESRTGRRRGEEDLRAPSARKGIAGDWRNHFSPEAARLFDELAGENLIELGYESDHSWVETVE